MRLFRSKYFTYMSVFPNSLRRQGSFTEFCGFQNPRPCGRITAAGLLSHSYRCCPLTAVSYHRINFCAAGALEAAQTLQLEEGSFPPHPKGKGTLVLASISGLLPL